MRKKRVLTIVGVIAVLAVVLSVTAFAADSGKLTEYNLIEVIRQSLEMAINAFFKSIDAVYLFFAKLFGKA